MKRRMLALLLSVSMLMTAFCVSPVSERARQQMRKWFKRLRRIYSSASGWKKENRITTSFPAARRSLSHRQWA